MGAPFFDIPRHLRVVPPVPPGTDAGMSKSGHPTPSQTPPGPRISPPETLPEASREASRTPPYLPGPSPGTKTGLRTARNWPPEGTFFGPGEGPPFFGRKTFFWRNRARPL